MLVIDGEILILHMKKCGGTSFCRGLIDQISDTRLEYYGYTSDGEVRSQSSKAAGGVWKHSSALEARQHFGPERFAQMEKWFVSTRPYWERVASFYFYAKRHNQRDPGKYPFAGELSFAEYIRSRHMLSETVNDYVCDEAGNCLVDRIVRYDDLGKIYRRLANRFGAENPTIPNRNRNPVKTDYLSDYNGEDWAHLARKFKSEIDFLSTTDRIVPKRG